MKRVHLQIGFAGLTMLLAIIFYIHTIDLPKTAYQLPRILIGIVILLSVAMVIEQVFSSRKNLRIDTKKPDCYNTLNNGHLIEEESKIQLTRIFVFIMLVSGYILTIEKLGYFIVTPIYIIATYLYLKATKFYKIILIAVGFTVFVYLLFVLFLHLPVPMGFLVEGE